MTDETDNLILAHLRKFDTKLDAVIADMAEIKTRLHAVEQHVYALTLDIAAMRGELHRQGDRLDRIEKRLGLIEA